MINRKRLAAILKGNKRTVKGIAANKTIEIQYRKTLLSLVRDIGKFNLQFVKELTISGLIKDSVYPDYNAVFNARFSKNFESLANNYPEKWIGKSDAIHKRAFINEINSKIGINLTSILRDNSNNVGRVVTHRIKENSDLIKSLAGDYKEQAREAIHESLISGDNVESLRSKLGHIEGVTESRAELIARDQTQKVFSELNEARQKDIGVTGYYWRGIEDGRERDSHIENNGERFSWDSPPEETGHPGDDVNCRCVADPDLTGFLENLPEE